MRWDNDNQGAAFEPLEERLLLAGSVTAIVSSGTLKITGDNAANEITITAGAVAGQFIVTGTGTTVNGGAADTLDGVTKDFKINLKAGANVLTLDDVIVPGNLKIQTGNHSDTVTIQDSDVTGDTLIKLKCGLNVVNIGPTEEGEPGTFSGSVVIKLGNCPDTVNISDTTFNDEFRIDTKRGTDTIAIDPTTFEGDFAVYTGGGADSVTLADCVFEANATLNTGSENDTVTVNRSESAFGHLLSITTGSGDDTLTIDGTEELEPAAVLIDGGELFAGTTTIDTAEGEDTVVLTATSFANLLMDLGSEDDTLTMNDVEVTTGTADGGSETDIFTEDSSGNTGDLTFINFELGIV